MPNGRRKFLAASAAAATTALAAPWCGAAAPSLGSVAPTRSAVGDAVRRLYAGLSASQRSEVVLDHSQAIRTRADANFAVTSPRIGSSFYREEQRTLLRQLLQTLLSSEGYERVSRQMDRDAGGLGNYHMAFFPAPKTRAATHRFEAGSARGQTVEWLLSGRHITLRASTALGSLVQGPRVYGDGQFRPDKTLYYQQSVAANALWAALPPAQRSRALLEDSPFEEEVSIASGKTRLPGLKLQEISLEQRPLLRALVESLAGLFEPHLNHRLRQAMLGPRGLAQATIAYYREDDLGNDGHWDIWRVQGPGFTWHYRGAPHVHAYLNLG